MSMGDYYSIDENFGAPDEGTPGGSPVFFPTPPRQRARPAEKWEPGTWVTKEGQKLRISEMEDGHLVNSLQMLKRRGFVGWRILSAYLGGGPNGDMARDLFDHETDEVFSRPYHPAFDDLEDEVRRRGFRP